MAKLAPVITPGLLALSQWLLIDLRSYFARIHCLVKSYFGERLREGDRCALQWLMSHSPDSQAGSSTHWQRPPDHGPHQARSRIARLFLVRARHSDGVQAQIENWPVFH